MTESSRRMTPLSADRTRATRFRVCCAVAVLAAAIAAVPGPTRAAGEPRLPYYDSATFTPQWLEPGSDALEGFHRIPDFRFVDQAGAEIGREDVEGRIYVANFFFSTCPGICPRMQSRVHRVQDRFRDTGDVLILSHTVTPGTDTPEVLAEYGAENGVDPAVWHLLTGDKEEIYRIAIEHYFANEDFGATSDNVEFLHTANVLLIDRDRHIRGIYNGLNDGSMDHLIEDIEKLREERDPRDLAASR